MHRIDGAGATEDEGFTEGDPAEGIPPTVVTDAWLTAVQEEVVGVIEAAGLTLDKEDNTQLLQAIGILQGAATGDVIMSFRSAARAGWILVDDGSIGDAASSATTRANADTSDLFALLWTNVANAFAPLQDSSGEFVARGGSAAEDFAAHRRLVVPKLLGRALAVSGTGSFVSIFTANASNEQLTIDSNSSIYTGAVVQASTSGTLPAGLSPATNYYAIRVSATVVQLATTLSNAHAGTAINVTDTGSGVHLLTMQLTARTLGQHVGEESHALTISEMPEHRHNIGTTNDSGDEGAHPGQCGFSPYTNDDTTALQGGNAAHNIMQPTTFLNLYMKL